MAQRGIQLDMEKLCCSICLEVLRDPVTIPCGHSYCMRCIKSCWDIESKWKVHSADRASRQGPQCPQCRKSFTPRPILMKNTVLTDLVEKLKKAGLQQQAEPSPAQEKCHARIRHGQEAELFRYSRQITLDPNTASAGLFLSDGNRKATFMEQKQLYSPHPDRFWSSCQVLSSEALSGRSYWEVEWSGFRVSVAVAYRNISREGDQSYFGYNNHSWSLECYIDGYYFRHDGIQTPVFGPQSSRVGVDLDHDAGVLSFCSVSESRTLLHRVHTTFTQPLHAGLWIGFESTAEFCQLE
ncbi:hypothetical protein LDENG_00159460 [Lucifuga dentata]|nr:hypothetical protein LDENG_00159460 [Lucifuga dentata]